MSILLISIILEFCGICLIVIIFSLPNLIFIGVFRGLRLYELCSSIELSVLRHLSKGKSYICCDVCNVWLPLYRYTQMLFFIFTHYYIQFSLYLFLSILGTMHGIYHDKKRLTVEEPVFLSLLVWSVFALTFPKLCCLVLNCTEQH